MDWSTVKYFKPEEFGDTEAQDNIHSTLVWLLDKFREVVGRPIKIHEAWAKSGHSANSYHYKGEAVDLHIEGLSLWEQFFAALKFGVWRGIGIYPFWHDKGLHLDIRKQDMPIIWYEDHKGNYIYNPDKDFYKLLMDI